jgi:predicted glycoside hydrolase/deacetylase ChbG (UPF0249 family)
VRVLIVNADDFGLSEAVNRGVATCFERGVVTSASLMVHGRAAADAAEYARAHPGLAVGLHLDLAEWEYRGGVWISVYERCRLDDPDAVASEAEAQLAVFRRLLGRDPTHVDSHQHVHREDPAASVARALAGRLGVPLRHERPIRYRGDFYGWTKDGDRQTDAVRTEALLAIVAQVEPGVTELACHPGAAGSRAREVKALCDPRVHRALAEAGIALRSFADIRLTDAASRWRTTLGTPTRGAGPIA